MEKPEVCCRTGEAEDKDGKPEGGECKLKWTLHVPSSTSKCIFVSRRLQCSDPLSTFITPSFFLRLQVVLKNLADQWGMEVCSVKQDFCRLILKDMEILVEYSDYSNYFLDIMAKSYLSQQDTTEFLEAKIMSEMRRLCASPKGCQGVTLVEAIIRPECVGEDIMLCRFRQSVQVGTLEQLVVCAPGLKCLKFCWPAVKDEYGNTVLPTTLYKPQDLLGPKRSGCKQALCYPDSNVGAGRRRGVAVIVSMVKYSSKYGDRSGGRDDEAKLMTLIDELQFEVKLLQDLTAGELQGEIKEIATTSICAQDESFLCFVMGHGNSTFDGEQCVLDQNGDIIMVDDIVRPFTTCQHLHGKPKVFFVISCRGRHVPLLPQPEWNEGTELRYLEEFPDCLIVFSGAVGTVSVWRRGYGTPLVRALVASFNTDNLQTMDVLGILTHVKKVVKAEEKDGLVCRKSPFVMHTLTKLLYWKIEAV